MYFRHELGKMVGINTILLVISPFSGGIIGGPIIQHLGWRFSQWISGGIMGLALLGMIFLVPEVVQLVPSLRNIADNFLRLFTSEKTVPLRKPSGDSERPSGGPSILFGLS